MDYKQYTNSIRDLIVINVFFILRLDLTSDVVRVPCALGQEVFLRPPSTKTTEL